MKYLLKSLLGLVVLTAALATQAKAQLVTYQFTGTLLPEYSSAEFGSTISGSLTLDVGATPDFVFDFTPYFGSGQLGEWRNDGFSINGMTDTGFAAGTALGWTNYFGNQDVPTSSFTYTVISAYSYDGSHARGIQVYSVDNQTVGDGLANVPNPWDPLADEYQRVLVWDYDYTTNNYETAEFTLDTFTLKPTTIIIDGRDTGIDDFVYDGKLVSKHLDEFAADAKNHGGYVSCVAKLTNELKKAGLLTDSRKDVIMSCAAKSNIGK